MGIQQDDGTMKSLNAMLSVFGNYTQGLAKVNQYEAAVRDAENMAGIAKMDAAAEARRQKRANQDKANALRKGQRRAQSQALAKLGASGVTLSGSPLQVMEGQVVEDAADYQSLLASGQDEVDAILRSGARQRAAYQATAASRRSAANNAWTTFGLNMFDTILSNGPDIFGSWGR